MGDVIECDAAKPEDFLAENHKSKSGRCRLAEGIQYVQPLTYFSKALRRDGFNLCNSLQLIMGGLWPPVHELAKDRTARDLEYLTGLVRLKLLSPFTHALAL